MNDDGRLSRRGFVGAGAGTAAVAAWGAPGALARRDDYGGRGRGSRLLPRRRIGIQLFTVRDQVAALGFEAVFARSPACANGAAVVLAGDSRLVMV